MTAQLIDGKMIAQKVREGVAAEVSKRAAAGKPQPALATVLVGDRPDSAAYVASKGKACQELGMGSISEHLPADATQEQVEELVKRLNANPQISGILVQLPLPAHLDEERVLSLINIEKMWTVSHPSILAAWPKKDASPSSFHVRLMAASTLSNRWG